MIDQENHDFNEEALDESNFVGLNFKYGGKFVVGSQLAYMHMQEKLVRVDPDTLNYWNLFVIIRDKLGYANVSKMHYLPAGKTSLTDLLMIVDDLNVSQILMQTSGGKNVDIYIEHGESLPVNIKDKYVCDEIGDDVSVCSSWEKEGYASDASSEPDMNSGKLVFKVRELQRHGDFAIGDGFEEVGDCSVNGNEVVVNASKRTMMKIPIQKRNGEKEKNKVNEPEMDNSVRQWIENSKNLVCEVNAYVLKPKKKMVAHAGEVRCNNDEDYVSPRVGDMAHIIDDNSENEKDNDVLFLRVPLLSDDDDEELIEARKKVKNYNRIAGVGKDVAHMKMFEYGGNAIGVAEEKENEVEGVVDGFANVAQEIRASVGDVPPSFNLSQRYMNVEASVYYDSEGQYSVETAQTENDTDESVVEEKREREGKSRKCSRIMYDPKLPFDDFDGNYEFINHKQFKEALQRYAVNKRVDYKLERNCKSQIIATCKGKSESCPWRLYGCIEKTTGKFVVRTYKNEHVCNTEWKSKRVTAKVVADFYKERITNTPKLKSGLIKELAAADLEVNLNFTKIKRAKNLIQAEMEKNYFAEFENIWRYAKELRFTNLGTTVNIHTAFPHQDAKPHFKRIYVCLEAVKKGFLDGCRKFIGLDGCFLKGICKGELLTAVGKDGANQMYPVAWAIVEVENINSWTWFVDLLASDLLMGEGDGWCIILDQQKGLIEAVHTVLPKAERRLCVRHLYANWKKKFRGADSKIKYWSSAKSFNMPELTRWLEALSIITPEGYVALTKIHPRFWCKAFFSEQTQVDNIDNNLCETFNGVIVESRDKAFITMLEEIRVYVMERKRKKREEALKWKFPYGPKIRVKLLESQKLAKGWKVVFNGDNGFEVKKLKEKHVVHLQKRTCTCRKWMMTGIPCEHAYIAIVEDGKDPDKYLAKWFYKEYFLKAYTDMIQPIRGMHFWPTSTMIPLLPPLHRRMPGRRKKLRIREEGERNVHGRTRRIMTCTTCLVQGHNKKGCPNKNKPNSTREVRSSKQVPIPTVPEAPINLRDADKGKKKVVNCDQRGRKRKIADGS